MTQVTNTPPPIDGFDDPDAPSSGGAKFLKFDGSTATKWFLREDGSPAPKVPYFVVDIWEELIKWVDRQPVDRIRKQPGQPLPDLDEFNGKCPKSEWRQGLSGGMVGPWDHTYNFGLVDPDDGSRYIYSNGTKGTEIAYGRLRDHVTFERSKRNERVIPVVELSSSPMKTKMYGLKERPAFEIVEWRAFGGSAPVTLAPPDALPGKPVEPLTASEVVNDMIDDVSPAPKKRKAKAQAPVPEYWANKPGKATADSNPDDGFPTDW